MAQSPLPLGHVPDDRGRAIRRALVTGITGQDGSDLTELLLAKGYEVHGLIRRASTFNTDRIDHLYQDVHAEGARLFMQHGDLTDGGVLRRVIERVMPDEIYHLGAQSHVRVSFEEPQYTTDVGALGTLRVLEAVRDIGERTGRQIRVYNAGSSEMYGASAPPQNEDTPFHPRSPYAVAKVAAHWFAVNYRDGYGVFVCNGILFNHESPRRGETFVTRKITRAVGRIATGLQEKLYLGNLDAKRDGGFAGDYVEAMWLMLQQDEPDDYVVATGESHSVREALDVAFGHAGLDWKKHVEIDPRYFRPTEVDYLKGDSSKARAKLGWRPKVGFVELLHMMVDTDMELARQESTLRMAGHDYQLRGSASY